MKSLSEFINESSKDSESSVIGKKILNALHKDSSDIVSAIIKRTEKWDENKFEWSREPMFLIAESGNINVKNDAGESVRNLNWIRKKFFDTSLEGETSVSGTLSNYNITNDVGDLPLSVLGVFFDRQFFPITSIDTYNTIKNIIDSNN